MRCVSGFNYAEIKRATGPLLTERDDYEIGTPFSFSLRF